MPVLTLDRYVGTLWGGAIGDALGRPYEGSRPKGILPPLTEFLPWSGWTHGPKGTITDDTQLTMCVAECYRAQGALDPEDLARRLVQWLPHGRGKGRATVSAAKRLCDGTPWYLAGERSAGNGAAMRSAPVGLVRSLQSQLLRLEATLSAIPTHSAPMAIAGAVAMASAVAFLVARDLEAWGPEELVRHVQTAIDGLEPEALPERRDPTVRSTLRERLGVVLELLGEPPEDAAQRLYCGAYVLESVPLAFWAFLTHRDDPVGAIVTAARCGYDADTTACMAGTLGGPRREHVAFRRAWSRNLSTVTSCGLSPSHCMT